MKLKWLLPALCAAIFLLIGIAGHEERQTELQMSAVQTCEQSYRVYSGDLERRCGDLIDEVQKDGKHEVLSKNGDFWIEVKHGE